MLSSRAINRFYLLCYLAVLATTLPYLAASDLSNWQSLLFASTVYLTYGILYLFPAWLLSRLGNAVIGRLATGVMARRLAVLWISLWPALTMLILFVDTQIVKLYGFHINGFVLNIFSTPGGLESMGMSDSTLMVASLAILVIVVACMLVLHLLDKRMANISARPVLKLRYLLLVFFALTLGERVAYGVSHITSYTPVLVSANAFALYQPLTFRSFAKKFGIKRDKNKQASIDSDIKKFTYPLKAIEVKAPARPKNIVWLMAESWRADTLDAEIMPNTYAFAEKSQRFTRHYSGSNSTRMGVFSAFYGLIGSYWFPALDARKGPVLFDVLKQQDYQWKFFTSQKFTYPEFDRTVFADIPRSQMQSYITGQGWQRDDKNVTDLLQFIEQRDPQRPFMTYMFFESPHARYYFPEESAIRKPYLEDFNYATMDLVNDIGLIKNRYINSVHYMDGQLQRVFAKLKQENLLDDTIVIVTGDHGEEFMEHGHWGHGSSLVKEQTNVPLIMWLPGEGSRVETRMTSHIDIIPTLLPRLGVQNPSSDYALGEDLLNNPQRDYSVIVHWRDIGFIDENYKASFSMSGPSSLLPPQVLSSNDEEVKELDGFYKKSNATMLKVVQMLKHFTPGGGS